MTEGSIVVWVWKDEKVSKAVILLILTELVKTLVSLSGNMEDAIINSVSWLTSGEDGAGDSNGDEIKIELPNIDSEISVPVSFILSSEEYKEAEEPDKKLLSSDIEGILVEGTTEGNDEITSVDFVSPVSLTENITLDGINDIESMTDAAVDKVVRRIDSDAWYISDENVEEYSRKEVVAFLDDSVDIIVVESVSLSASDFDTAEIEEFDTDKVCISSIVNPVDGDISCEDKCDAITESSDKLGASLSEDNSDVLDTETEADLSTCAVNVDMTSVESKLNGSEAIMVSIEMSPSTLVVGVEV